MAMAMFSIAMFSGWECDGATWGAARRSIMVCRAPMVGDVNRWLR